MGNDSQHCVPKTAVLSLATACIAGCEMMPNGVYNYTDFATHECVKREMNGVLYGVGCPSAPVLSGPYVFVSPNSIVHMSFEFETLEKVTLMSDMVSMFGTEFHAALDPIALDARETRKLELKVHTLEPVRGLEARIGVAGEGRANFQIRNLRLEIE